jgi:hypothetical protein
MDRRTIQRQLSQPKGFRTVPTALFRRCSILAIAFPVLPAILTTLLFARLVCFFAVFLNLVAAFVARFPALDNARVVLFAERRACAAVAFVRLLALDAAFLTPRAGLFLVPFIGSSFSRVVLDTVLDR